LGTTKGAELQKREQQLSYAQQALSQQLQQESGTEMDTLVSGVKKFIKAYGKEKGYSYIYGTGDAASVLYAEDKYDITKDIIKALNDKYKSSCYGRESRREKQKLKQKKRNKFLIIKTSILELEWRFFLSSYFGMDYLAVILFRVLRFYSLKKYFYNLVFRFFIESFKSSRIHSVSNLYAPCKPFPKPPLIPYNLSTKPNALFF
jgi:thiamine phosphate synthase YjbQ (UPF0047 family)